MAKYQQTTSLWSSCRRKIIEAMKCGGRLPKHKKAVRSPISAPKTSISECRSDTTKSISSSKVSNEENVKLKEVVNLLVSEKNDDVLLGAKKVRELAKEDSETRTNFGLLGAISPLVRMLDSKDLDFQISALYALLNLGIGNDMNKSSIVEAGLVHKMLDLVQCTLNDGSPNQDLLPVIVANFLGLSALDSNKQIIGSSGAISFLIKTLKGIAKTEKNSQMIQDSLRAIYNLSILSSNVLPMVEVDGFVPFLLNAIGDIEVSDRILSIVSNIVSTHEGRKAVSVVQNAFTILVDVLNWVDLPSCQEKATYILMVMAHKSYVDRQAMIDAGIMSSLLELTLIGSTLAQKRSSKILEILKNNKGKQVSDVGATLSAPLCGSIHDKSVDPSSKLTNNNAVRQLVEQSLQNNMTRMVKRANFPRVFAHLEHSKSSIVSFSSSKSLPF
ncbi:U-box domain-containing protein 45-like [Rutidosis leptorrhynchoides]|uniref:U-box domain-containing protein 45-like n=1 Tax=Rutidosis leptorrhynchoides TaxID=125765 RepID=UPI003A98D85A